MAASTTNNSSCATCDKATGIFRCRGCGQDFCMRHANEHRQTLTRQMEENVLSAYDQLRYNFTEQNTTLDIDSLTKQIDEWEQQSINKIHQTAANARQQVVIAIDKHKNKLTEALEQFAEQLKKARDDDNFFETDLDRWMKKLNNLKRDLNISQTISLRYDDMSSFMSKIQIAEVKDLVDERFEPSIGHLTITDNGTVIVHNETNKYAAVRSKDEYSVGIHRFQFKIEQLNTSQKWLFLGVRSKNAPTPTILSIGPSAYGWSGHDDVWVNGYAKNKHNGYKNDFEINDIVTLIVDCDQRKIYLMNQRTLSRHMLDVDLGYCPFPWQLSVGLYNSPGESIRLLL